MVFKKNKKRKFCKNRDNFLYKLKNNKQNSEYAQTRAYPKKFNNQGEIKKNKKLGHEKCEFYEFSGDGESREVQQYFQRVFDRLKDGFDDREEKDIFTQNVLQQTEGKEVELCFSRISSYCIQTLLEFCEEFQVISRFMKSFSEVVFEVCMNPFASHITETLLRMGLKFLQASQNCKSQTSDQEIECKQEEIISFITSWILSFGNFCLENINELLFDVYGCHVLRTVVEVLGGHIGELKISQSKKARIQKRQFNEVFEGLDFNAQPSSNLNTPKEFLALLKKISKKIFKSEKITDYAKDVRVSPLLQAILIVLKRHKPKLCKKLVNQLITEFFPNESEEKKMSTTLINKNSSYVIEHLIIVAEKEQHAFIWEECIRSFLKELIDHPVAGFIIQKMFATVTDKLQFEHMFDAVSSHFSAILESHHYGILVAIAKGCNRLNARQAQFTKALMEIFHCLTPEDRCSRFVCLVLGFLSYECYHTKQGSEDKSLEINLHGSLIVQELLKFHKPIKIVNSILSIRPEELSFLTCHIQGCHILTAFMQSQSIGEKNKDKLICCLKPNLSNILCDANGSKTFARIWAEATLKQKQFLATEILHREHTLRNNHWGNMMLKKCAISHFKNRNELWKQVQSTNIKKRKMFIDIIEDAVHTKKIKTSHT